MQMIDVYATAGVFLDKHQLALDLVYHRDVDRQSARCCDGS